MHRGHTAIRPHHAGHASHLGGHRRVVGRVDGHRVHFRVALVIALVELAQAVGKRSHRDHTRHPLHGPDEAVLILAECNVLAVVRPALDLDLEHHTEPVQTDVVMAGDRQRIPIEARILAQFRGAGLQGTDHSIMALPGGRDKDQHRHAQHPAHVVPFAQTRETVQPTSAALARNFLGRSVTVLHAEHRGHHRQHHQIGDDLERDPQ